MLLSLGSSVNYWMTYDQLMLDSQLFGTPKNQNEQKTLYLILFGARMTTQSISPVDSSIN